MNTSEFYARQRTAPPTPPRAAKPDTPATPHRFAALGYPSLRGAPTAVDTAVSPRSTTRWVRPVELTDVGMRAVGRVIDHGFDAQARAMRATVRGVGAAARRLAPPQVPPTTSNERDGMTL